MNDIISRSALIDSLYSCEGLKGRRTIEAVITTINEQPTVEPVRGEWIKRYTTLGVYYECSICGQTNKGQRNFCGYCGADMRGGQNGRT